MRDEHNDYRKIYQAARNLLADHIVAMTLTDGTVIKSTPTNSIMAYELSTWVDSFFDHVARVDVIRLNPTSWEEEMISEGADRRTQVEKETNDER